MIRKDADNDHKGIMERLFGACGPGFWILWFRVFGFYVLGPWVQGLYCNHKSLGLGLGSATLASVKQLKISDLLDPEPATSDLLALDPKPNPTIGP